MGRSIAITAADTRLLTGKVDSAMATIRYFMTGVKPVLFLNAILGAACRGVQVTLIIPAGGLQQSGLTERYLEKLTMAGGRVFLVGLEPEDLRRLRVSRRDILIIDDTEVLRPDALSGTWFVIDETTSHWCTIFTQLQELSFLAPGAGAALPVVPKVMRKSARPPASSVVFAVSAKQVQQGEHTTLHWSVPAADVVEIRPQPGLVSSSGKALVKINHPQEFMLLAKVGAQEICKMLKVEISPELDFRYWLVAFDPAPGVSEQLLRERPDLPGRFGVLEGQRVLLRWAANNAAKVWLDDQPVSISGERSLEPAGVLHLRFKALSLNGSLNEYELILKTFSLPASVPDPPEATVIPQLQLPPIGNYPTPDAVRCLNELPLREKKVLEQMWRKHRRGKGIISRLQDWWNKKPG